MIFLLVTETSVLIIYISNIQRTQQYTAVMYNFQVCHNKTHFKGCHVKTYQNGQSLEHAALRPEIGQMAKTFGFVYSWNQQRL